MHSELTCKKHVIYSHCTLTSTPLGPIWRHQCEQLPTWDSAINSVHVPIEVGKFQSDSSRSNPMFSAILCFKMAPECILSRLAKNTQSFLLASWHRRLWGQTGAGSASSLLETLHPTGVLPSALWCCPTLQLPLCLQIDFFNIRLDFFSNFHRSMRTC